MLTECVGIIVLDLYWWYSGLKEDLQLPSFGGYNGFSRLCIACKRGSYIITASVLWARFICDAFSLQYVIGWSLRVIHPLAVNWLSAFLIHNTHARSYPLAVQGGTQAVTALMDSLDWFTLTFSPQFIKRTGSSLFIFFKSSGWFLHTTSKYNTMEDVVEPNPFDSHIQFELFLCSNDAFYPTILCPVTVMVSVNPLAHRAVFILNISVGNWELCACEAVFQCICQSVYFLYKGLREEREETDLVRDSGISN